MLMEQDLKIHFQKTIFIKNKNFYYDNRKTQSKNHQQCI